MVFSVQHRLSAPFEMDRFFNQTYNQAAPKCGGLKTVEILASLNLQQYFDEEKR